MYDETRRFIIRRHPGGEAPLHLGLTVPWPLSPAHCLADAVPGLCPLVLDPTTLLLPIRGALPSPLRCPTPSWLAFCLAPLDASPRSLWSLLFHRLGGEGNLLLASREEELTRHRRVLRPGGGGLEVTSVGKHLREHISWGREMPRGRTWDKRARQS